MHNGRTYGSMMDMLDNEIINSRLNNTNVNPWPDITTCSNSVAPKTNNIIKEYIDFVNSYMYVKKVGKTKSIITIPEKNEIKYIIPKKMFELEE